MNGNFRRVHYFIPCLLVLFLSRPPVFAHQLHAIVPYHGMRMTSKHSDFYVVKIEAEKAEAGNLLIDVHFSSAVDPRTVALPDVLVNGRPVPSETSELFNKAGTEVRFKFPASVCRMFLSSADTRIKLEFVSAASFNGSPLIQNAFDGITDGYVQVFKKPAGDGSY